MQTAGPTRVEYRHDMAVVESVRAALVEAGISFAAYLPDTILHPVISAVEATPEITAVGVTREDEGVGVCVGAFLGGKWPVLLCEGSGLGLSGLILARAVVQRTPMLILASHNTVLGERHDYTSATRRTTEPFLDGLNIPYVVAMRGEDLPLLIREAQLTVQGDRRPIAVLLPRHTLHQ